MSSPTNAEKARWGARVARRHVAHSHALDARLAGGAA